MILTVVDIEVSDLHYGNIIFLTFIKSIRSDTKKLSSPCASGWVYAHSLTIF